MTFRFEVESTRFDNIPTMARIYDGQRVVAVVNRTRRTKRSPWKVTVSIREMPHLSIADATTWCNAVLTMAAHPWGDE